MAIRRKLIAIVGATATGKTDLGVELARAVDGEIVSADSRQVCRHMTIGTAKPTPDDLAAVPHHLIDIVDPDEPFSLGAWLDLAHAAIEDIWGRGRVPLIVGGTGQFVWALIEGWRVPRVPPQPELREHLSGLPAAELLEKLRAVDPGAEAYIDPRNVRRVIRALEVRAVSGRPLSYWRTTEPPDFDALVIGLALPRTELYRRIDARVDSMFDGGLVEEVKSLRARGYARELPAMSGIGYREVCEYLDGECTLEAGIERTKKGTHRLARHQNAWFKVSDRRIKWITDPGAGVEMAREWLVGASL
jgi:tRNA dimethylallyltransferase